MREIKFRALAQDSGIGVFDCYVIDLERKIALHANGEWYDYIELIQFIGVKDKKGNEIYVGHIVKEGKFNDVSDNNKEKDILYIIEWKQENLGFCWKQVIPVLTSGLNLEESEIVGNIYESPELLK